MARSAQLSDLMSRRFLREIHHFLWTDPSVCGEGVDAGWNCRDHTLVAAFLVQSLGYKPALFHGEAFFVKGQTEKSGSVSFYQRPHSWIVVEGVGAVDLSIKPDLSSAGDNFRMPISCIFANQWIPRGKGNTSFTEDGEMFAQATGAILHRCNQASAVYLVREAESFHAGHLACAAGFAGSPLTRKLDAIYGNPSDLYATLMMHLHSFLEGSTQSLSGLPFEIAWRRLAGAREGAIDRASLHIEAKTTTPPQNRPDAAVNLPQGPNLGVR